MFLPSDISGFNKARLKERTDALHIKADNNSSTVVWSKSGLQKIFYPPVKIFGSPIDDSCLNDVRYTEFKTPDIVLSKINSAIVVGPRAVYSRNQLYLTDFMDGLHSVFDKYNSIDKIFNGYFLSDNFLEDGHIYVKKREANHVINSALFIHDLEPGNFGSFCFRVLPQLLWFKKIGIKVDYIFISQPNSWYLQVLEYLFDGVKFIDFKNLNNFSISDLYCFNDFSFEGLFDSDTKLLFQQFVNDFAPAKKKVSDKVFVSRLFSNLNRSFYRPLINESDIEVDAASLGYMIIHPDFISFKEQLRTICYADKVISTSGSNCYPLLLSLNSPNVLHLESFTVRQAYKLFCTADSNYYGCFGRFVDSVEGLDPLRPWVIDDSIYSEAIRIL
jgi:Glycosyltransferase 61